VKLIQWIEQAAHLLDTAGVSFGHGTENAFDESVWLTLWQLGLALDTDLTEGAISERVLTPDEQQKLQALFKRRIETRKPSAYLTQEAWLQGVPFYVDERVIVPRSLIAELLVSGTIDPWLNENTHKVLDLCTGNGSLAILAAMEFPDVMVCASDLSLEALEVAKINVDKHALASRIQLFHSDGLLAPALVAKGPFDLILCNPPYVNAQSMAGLPAEFRAEPAMALDGNLAGGTDGMDFVRTLLAQSPKHLTEIGILVLEIGHERAHFETAFPALEGFWPPTSAGDDQVVVLTFDALKKNSL
jgi:ribosomal protein L3 glutamine methyltransferase